MKSTGLETKFLVFCLTTFAALLAVSCGGGGASTATLRGIHVPTATPVAATADSPNATVTRGTKSAPARDPNPATPLPSLPTLRLAKVFGGHDFNELTNLVQPDDGTGRFFLAEQPGRILVLDGADDAELQVLLDIRDRVSTASREEGLLGLALDPAFANNGHLWVYYSAADPRRSVVSRFTVGVQATGGSGPQSGLVILEVPQPFPNHNGGQLAFGPDGYLYIGLGDGGAGGDPQGNGQDLATWLGSILRIDVSQVSPEAPYRIPKDNPFIDRPEARPEIWAYGLRNPWRFSFDADTGELWTGDVGQNRFEEIDLVERGGNYGWNVMEGTHCFSPSSGCDSQGTTLPVLEYGSGQGCSVIGGYVYRGQALPSLEGAYLYADFCSGEIFGARYGGREVIQAVRLADTGLNITSFGQDISGELYVLSRNSGVYRLAP